VLKALVLKWSIYERSVLEALESWVGAFAMPFELLEHLHYSFFEAKGKALVMGK